MGKVKVNHKLFTLISVLLISVLVACGSNEDSNKEIDDPSTGGDASGIMLAGEELPESSGVMKSVEANDEVVVTVNGQDVFYRLSEEAKRQVDEKVVEVGSEVTFKTFSIGDSKETIDQFVVQ